MNAELKVIAPAWEAIQRATRVGPIKSKSKAHYTEMLRLSDSLSRGARRIVRIRPQSVVRQPASDYANANPIYSRLRSVKCHPAKAKLIWTRILPKPQRHWYAAAAHAELMCATRPCGTESNACAATAVNAC